MSAGAVAIPGGSSHRLLLARPLLAKLLLVGLLGLKLAITGLNAQSYDNRQYDWGHHVWRARTAGLETGKMAYNPPLYYLPTLAILPEGEAARRKADPEPLLELLRHTNVAWLGLFYACWIFVIFPRALPDRRTALVASLLLLALPGYQKLGMLAHPDNALAALSALLIAAWLLLRERIASGERNWLPLAALAVCTGLVGATRPFAIVPVGLFWLVTMLELRRAHPGLGRAFLTRALVASLIGASIAGSWYVYRWASSSTVTEAYNDGYMAKFIPHRDGFDFLPYFTTFHFRELVEVPNRRITALDRESAWQHNRYANSFFTLLYSETWGDHWLYFSGPVGREGMLEEKRRLLWAALPLVPLLIWRFGRGVGRALREGRGDPLAPSAVLAAFFLFGTALYLYWQTGPGLLPGKNSTIKFIYNAHLYPVALGLCFLAPVGRRSFWPWVAYALGLAGLALPLVSFPGGG